jgi:hypothetical protein
MPRRKASAGTGSAFQQVQQQAQSLLAGLRKEISDKEMELSRLKSEASSLSALVGRSSAPMPAARVAAPKATSASVSGGSGRINWRTVLTQVPKQFKASDVRDVRGLKSKRPSEIFAAITRWIDSGMAKRKARGVYERI